MVEWQYWHRNKNIGFGKASKNGNKEVYIKAKWATKRVVYDTERAAEKARF